MGGSVAGTGFVRLVAMGLVAMGGRASAQTTDTDVVELPTIDVVATAPIGAGAALDKVPAHVQSIDVADIAKNSGGGVASALDRRVASVGINEVSGNSFQPSLTYRGFEASPIAGTPQGLAVYQNGVRINEAFGDNVNWDLIPSNAVDRADIGGNDPAFGLNALGGALSLKMKTGFSFEGVEAEVSGGSYGRLSASVQFGKRIGDYSAYVAVEGLRDGGFRQFGASDIRRFYGDVGVKVDSGEIHLNIGAAQNVFGASAATPVQLLNQSWSAVYTTPQSSSNAMRMVNLTGAFQLAPTWSLDANAYVRSFSQRTVDGNTTDVQSCAIPGLLCFGNGATPANGSNGAQLVDTFGGAQLGEIDRASTRSTSLGGSAQLSNTDTLFDHANRLQVGASLDHSMTRFNASSELGVIGPNFVVTGSGRFLGPSGAPTMIGPVLLDATATYAGAWAMDTFDVTKQLSITLGGRFNAARIDLNDLLGGALTGGHSFQRFNPVAGLTYAITPDLSAYAGYSEANRAPTALELGCSNPNQPCIIANFLVSDPPLKQVVAHTVEAGLRGEADAPAGFGRVTWRLGAFRTDTSDDILTIPSNIQGFGYFANVGSTRRQGVEAEVGLRNDRVNAYAGYTYLDATFLNALALSSPNNPLADANGLIYVSPGNRLPMTPRHRFKAGAEIALTEAFKVNADLVIVGSQFFNGDAANLNTPLPAYGTVNAGASYRINKTFEVFAKVDNLLDRRYATFGTYFDINQIGFANFSDPRSLSPARPRSIIVGARATF